MKKSVCNKKAAMEISFGMIFAIILIIVFLSFAFFGIKKLLGVQEYAMISQFKSSLQEDVNKMWNGPQGQQNMTYNLPKKIDGVCFKESENGNLYFLPQGKFPGGDIAHIDLDKILISGKDKCFENKAGKVTITLKKDFGENLITLK